MILFQIDNFNLFYHIKDLKVAYKEDLQTFSIDSSFYEGDYRTYKNRGKKTVLTVKGFTSSQHLLHSLRSISEFDEGRGDIKVFFIEKYKEFSAEYQTLSDSNLERNKYRIYFNYAYIDIVAINPIYNANELIEYEVNFEISLLYTNNYEITFSTNAYYIDEEYIKSQPMNYYDELTFYNNNQNYDSFLRGINQDKYKLSTRNNNLNKWFEDLTCCKCVNNDYILFIDNFIKPFANGNLSTSRGIISKNALGDIFSFSLNNGNFIQLYLENPNTPIQNGNNSLITPLQAADIAIYKWQMRRLNLITNTWTTNAIIQIWRKESNQIEFLNYTLPVFDTLNQAISISIQSRTQVNSSFRIICKSQYLLDNLYGLIIHTHTQKLYGFLLPKQNQIESLNGFYWENDSQNLVDMESYILNGEIEVWNDSKLGYQEWFRLSPRYKNSIYETKGQDFLAIENIYPNANQTLPNGQVLFFQIYSLNENKLF